MLSTNFDCIDSGRVIVTGLMANDSPVEVDFSGGGGGSNLDLLSACSPSTGGADPAVRLHMLVNAFGSDTIYQLNRSTGAVLNSFPSPGGVNLDGLAIQDGDLFASSFATNRSVPSVTSRPPPKSIGP